jgi:hypothetical protein
MNFQKNYPVKKALYFLKIIGKEPCLERKSPSETDLGIILTSGTVIVLQICRLGQELT